MLFIVLESFNGNLKQRALRWTNAAVNLAQLRYETLISNLLRGMSKAQFQQFVA